MKRGREETRWEHKQLGENNRLGRGRKRENSLKVQQQTKTDSVNVKDHIRM